MDSIFEELKTEGLFLSNGNFNPSYIKKFNNSITEQRQQWITSLPGHTFSEKIYLFFKSKEIPICKECQNKVKFLSFKEGYREYCSLACRAIGTKTKIEETNLKRYGFKRPAQNKKIQEKIKQSTQMNFGVENIFSNTEYIKMKFIEKHGVSNPMFIPEIKEKRRSTNQKKFGVDYPSQVPNTIKKRSETNLKRYGNICSIHGLDVWEKVSNTKRIKFWNKLINSEKIKEIAIPNFTLEDYNGNIGNDNQVINYSWLCIGCNKNFEDYIANGNIPRCPHCYPSSTQGIMEKELSEWIRLALPNEEILFNSRKVIPPLEIDIYFPNRGIAIEFDEVYWHSELTTKGERGKSYHINKTLQCKEKGIQLIHIYDCEWFNNPEIIKSVLLSKFGIFSQKIGARQCSIKKISSKESRTFLEENHLQGYAGGSILYGLFYNNELVSHLSIGKNRFLKDTYEIVRFVSKLNTQVQGAFSKLWKESEKNIPKNSTIVSYVDLRYFLGKSNFTIGLKYKHTNPPSFFYTKDYKVLHNRLSFQKHMLLKKLEIFDSNLTEWENMQLNGYDRIWDCGIVVYSNK